MSVVVPLSVVHEEAQAVHSTLENTRACIVGPHAKVIDDARAGTYTASALSCSYPGLPEGALVDRSSIKVTLDAQLCYYSSDKFVPIDGLPDRVLGPDNLSRSSRWNAPEYQRAAVLKSRDVQIGDIVCIRDGDTEFRTTVIGLGAAPDLEPLTEPVDMEKLIANVQPIRTIMLQRNLPESMRDKKALHVALYVRKLIELAADKYTHTPQSVELPAKLDALDSQWFENGKPVPLPITTAEIKISYRAWLSTYSDKVYSANLDHVNKIFEQAEPDNPLVYGLRLAARNAGGLPVDFIAVADPTSLESWSASLFKIKKSYGIVGLSADPAILELIRKFVRTRSQAETGRECVTWQPLKVTANEILARCEVKIRALPAGGFIAETGIGSFMRDNIREGDMACVNDIDCVVGAVMNEDTLLLEAQGELPEEALLVVWRKRKPMDLAHAIGQAAAAIGDKRVRGVWPDQFSDGKNRNVPSYFLCAALAGLRSGTMIQQDLSSVQIAGVADVPRTTGLFEETELDMMAELGVWVVTMVDSIAITRSAITTADPQKLEESNESVVTNLDMINKALRLQTAEIVTTVRATTAMQTILRSSLYGKLQELSTTVVQRVGPQILDSEVKALRRHVILENNLVLSLRLVLPVKAGCGATLGRVEVQQKLVA